ncbi:glycine oxidase ThiO [Brevibacillus sp. SYP-B805]|nr:glycine oxidase ThiO [Brevibacillus sp. SYP-B805]
MECLITGGGIIGLSLARELADRGMSVTVVEQGEWGGQASSAAAGMLAPLKEFKEEGPLFELGIGSLALYPAWIERLKEETGLDPQMKLDGVLTVAQHEQEIEALLARYRWQQAVGCAVEWVEGQALHELEPLLSREMKAGIYSPGEGDVNNQLLLKALLADCVRRGVQLRQGTIVTGFLTAGTRVTGLQTTAGDLHADHTVVTAGAWASVIAAMLDVELPVYPVRGQVATVASAGIPLRHVIFGPTGYMVPKRDGRIVIGATEDEAGYRREVTLGGLSQVLNGVLPLVTVLRDAAFLQAWAGLRPATADGLPFLGPLPGWDGVSMAAGHFRNGILLAPITAKLMADWLCEGKMTPLVPFLPERVTGKTGAE